MSLTVEELVFQLGAGCETLESDQAQEVLALLCPAVVADLESRLKPGLVADQCEPAFSLGAAWTVLAQLEDCQGVKAFSVGDFSLTKKDDSGFGKKAEAILKPYLRSGSFGFYAVEG